MARTSVSSITARLLGSLTAGAVAAVLFVCAVQAQDPRVPRPSPDGVQSAAAPRTDRVEFIMGQLPPKGSRQYAALRALAGPDAQEHILPLTRCEVWSVRRSRMAGLVKAAREQNVSVKPLDQSWNQVLAEAPATMAMDTGTQKMMEQAKSAPSTAGMSVMSTRHASMVEYALTKGMGANDAGRPMSIHIKLNDTTTVTAVRRNVEITGDRCIWRGVVQGTEDPVTIMWWGSGRMTGTVHHQGRLYQLRQLAPNLVGIVETLPAMLPDEHPRTSPKRMQDMNMREDSLYKQGDSGAARPKRNDIENLKDDASGTKPPSATVLGSKGQRKSAANSGKPAGVVIDVMVAYTRKAASRYGDIRRDLIELAIEETNHSFRQSRIDGVSVRLIHTHETNYAEEGAEHFDHVWRMVDRGDGHLEEIPALRDAKKTDVVVLIVDDPSGCGLATRVAADADEAFAVVHHECAATSYSIAHEIGHILGARHDRSLDKSTAPFAYGHGYVSPDLKWRTMMSYKAACNGCPRLPIWSTPDPVMKGQPAGDQDHDNARVIRERAASVAAFR